MISNFFTKERLIIDFICALYLWLAAPVVSEIILSINSSWGNSTVSTYVLGFAIIIINLLEAFAMAPFVSNQLQGIEDKTKRYKIYTNVILLLFLHATICIVSLIMAFKLFGIDTDKNLGITIAAVVLVFAKEVYLIKNCFSKKPRTPINPLASRIILSLFSCLLFTIFLDSQQTPIAGKNIGATVLNIFAASIFFAFFYYPLRIPFLMQSVVHKPSTQVRLIGFVSFLMVLVPYIMRKM